MRPRWKILGLAGIAGVAATGVVVARARRVHRDYDPDELRHRLHRRLAEASTTDGVAELRLGRRPGGRRRLPITVTDQGASSVRREGSRRRRSSSWSGSA